MRTEVGEPKQRIPELVPLNVIRVETALSRYPVHRLAKQGTTSIEIREKSEAGDVVVQWKVSHNSEYGQPGPLAYKLDTLIVNRRIEQASRPVPKLIKLGSQASIAEELGISTHDTVSTIKKALYQNASVFITAKCRYRLSNGSEESLESGFTRYAVIFTGEKLSDGRTADAVYLELSDRFMQVLNGVQTRPLDYDYLKDLPPASQRLYELLSYQMFAALKHSRSRARLSYGEFCTHAPLTRHEEWLRVRTQMNKLHAPHKKSGYIQSVEFEQTIDRDGKPDWMMLYTPGPKARAEFRAFNKKGGPKTLEIEQAPPALELVAHQVEPTPLERELIARGVSTNTARELVSDFPEEQISRQVEHFDWLKEKHPKKVSENPGGFLASAVRDDYAPLKGFETKAQRAAREEAKREEQRRKAEAARTQQRAMAAELEQRAQVDAYLKGLEPAALERLEQEALAAAHPEYRAAYERANLPTLKRAQLRFIREFHVRRLLELPEAG